MPIMLSIITINYNNAPGLQKTMESVFAQTSQEFEYIVVDGDSTDESKEIIKQSERDIDKLNFNLKDKFTWISEKDSGIYNAMNKGIRMAKGEYCQFLNSGDWFVKKDATERMLRKLPECQICYGNMLKVLPDGTFCYNRKIPVITFLTLYRGSINHASAYIKRSLFDTYGLYDESLSIVSDWKFYLITVGLHNERVEYLDIDVCYFDMNGISNTNRILERTERRQVLVELIPTQILADYDAHWFDIDQISRIKRYKLIYKLVWFLERCLFKIEKIRSKS